MKTPICPTKVVLPLADHFSDDVAAAEVLEAVKFWLLEQGIEVVTEEFLDD